jgi:hypothetical protein
MKHIIFWRIAGVKPCPMSGLLASYRGVSNDGAFEKIVNYV